MATSRAKVQFQAKPDTKARRRLAYRCFGVNGAVEKGRTSWLDMPSGDCFAFAEEDGMIETMVDLGESVKKGNTIARIYPVGRTGLAPQEIAAKMDGVLAARHFPGLVKAGDCAAVIAVEG